MILFPAIDLKDGNCVRLFKGEMDKATVFSHNPAKQAFVFENAGAEWLHVVDLNGAFEGKSVNGDAVKRILENISIPIQLGGGIRDIEAVETWISLGVKRVILGTAALKNPALVLEACKKFPYQIVIGIDGRDGLVTVEGWAETSKIGVIELAKKFEGAGAAAIIYTDVTRDGAMQGSDFEGTKALAEAISIPVIASGGVSSLDDLRKLKQLEASGVAGVISGRAVYDKAFTIKDAKAILS
jgi:phosphoribosylformimino-5-aminoimidazole carboxamide ribotide isomerase